MSHSPKMQTELTNKITELREWTNDFVSRGETQGLDPSVVLGSKSDSARLFLLVAACMHDDNAAHLFGSLIRQAMTMIVVLDYSPEADGPVL